MPRVLKMCIFNNRMVMWHCVKKNQGDLEYPGNVQCNEYFHRMENSTFRLHANAAITRVYFRILLLIFMLHPSTTTQN